MKLRFFDSLILQALGLCIAILNYSYLAHAAKLDFKAAIHYAIQASPGLKSAGNSVSIAQLQHRNAVAKLLPSLDLSTSQGLQGYLPINGQSAFYAANPAATWTSSLTLGLTESLYDNGVSWTQLAITDLNHELSQVNFRKSRDLLILNVAAEFMRFSLVTQLLEVRKQQESLIQKQFTTLSYQYKQGFKTPLDYLRFKTQVQRSEIQRISAENDIQVSITSLQKLLGVSLQSSELPEFQPMTVKTVGKMESADFLPEEKPLISAFYDSKIYELQNVLNDKSIYLSRRAYWPQLSLNAGMSLVNPRYLNSNPSFWDGAQVSWNALLLLQYNILDWGSRQRDIQIAEFNANTQQNSLVSALMDTNAAINSLMLDIGRIRKNLTLNRELLEIEEQSFLSLETQYRNGKSSFLDLVTGFNSLLDAKIQYYSSYFEAQGANIKYQYYKGSLYDYVAGL